MKQIIFGTFGMILMLGILLAEWNMYSYTEGKAEVEQSVRAVEFLLKQRGEENLEEEQLRQWIDMELKERYGNTQTVYEIRNLDIENRKVQIRIKKEIPYFAEFPRIIDVEKEIIW